MTDNTKFFIQGFAATFLFGGIVCLWTHYSPQKVQAIEFKEVPPYSFAALPDGSAQIYKGVHEGCEYFVIHEHHFEMSHGDSISNSIALGRGCR